MRTSTAVRILALFLLLTAPLSASITLHVNEIGLKGWSGYSSRGMEPVRFTLENDGPAVTLNLEMSTITLTSGGSTIDSVYEERVLVPSGKTEMMRLISITPAESLRVELSGDDKKPVAYATSAGVTRSVIRGHLVVIYGNDQTSIENIRRSVIQSDNGEMRTRKERELDFVRVDSLETEPWYYNSASAIILAEPLVATAEQKRALELYVRCGGQLVVNAASAASTGFDAAYFNEADSARMGLGQVYEVSDFDASSLNEIGTKFLAVGSSGQTVLQDVAWRMRFPKTRTMIFINISYILVVGLFNFAILRRMGRLELGWITVPAVALVFTFAVIAFGASRGFTKIRIDQAETYYMDTHSPTAYVYDGVRVTSPSRGDFTLQLAPGDYFASDPNIWLGSFDKVHIGDDLLDQRADTFRRTRYFSSKGDRVGLALSMMRWSYEEWFGKRYEDLKGTVTVNGKSVTNGTGVRFKRAVLLDQNMNKLYDLGSIDVNATAELNSPQRLLPRDYLIEERRRERRTELNASDLASVTSMRKAFVGLVDEGASASPGPRVAGRASQETRTRIIVVGLE